MSLLIRHRQRLNSIGGDLFKNCANKIFVQTLTKKKKNVMNREEDTIMQR